MVEKCCRADGVNEPRVERGARRGGRGRRGRTGGRTDVQASKLLAGSKQGRSGGGGGGEEGQEARCGRRRERRRRGRRATCQRGGGCFKALLEANSTELSQSIGGGKHMDQLSQSSKCGQETDIPDWTQCVRGAAVHDVLSPAWWGWRRKWSLTSSRSECA